MPEKIKIDELYFHSESNAMYYVLGAWCASGKITKQKYVKKDHSESSYCGIEFTNKSKKLVQIIKNELQAKANPKLDDRGGRHFWWFKRHKTPTLCDRLEELGLAAKKNKIKFPKVPEEYLSHFIRGFFDARAIIHNKKDKTSIDMYFSEPFLAGLEKVLKTYAHVEPSRKKTGFRGYGHQEARKIYNFIYKDWPYIKTRGIYLPAKKKLFSLDDLSNQYTLETRAKEEIIIKKAKLLLANGMEVNKVSSKLDFSHHSAFIRSFKSITQMTPSEYQNSCPNIIEYLAAEIRDYETIRKAKALLAQDINYHEVASEVGFSDASDFAAYFREYTGTTPIKYQNSHYRVIMKRRTKKKLERGLNLLRRGWQVKRVSKKLGYSKPEHFARLVKKYTEMSPTEYQNKNLKRKIG